jgi:hypothetical protein
MLGLRLQGRDGKSFLSYRASDGAAIAKQLYDYLLALGHRPFLDEARELPEWLLKTFGLTAREGARTRVQRVRFHYRNSGLPTRRPIRFLRMVLDCSGCWFSTAWSFNPSTMLRALISTAATLKQQNDAACRTSLP